MDESDRDKLIKVLRMFGSDHDGEVTSAARRAHHIIKKSALDWDDLVMPEHARAHAQQQQQQQHYNNDGFADVEDEFDEAFLIRRASIPEYDKYLSDYERKFLVSIAGSLVEWGRLTVKQRGVLDRINNKLKLRGCW